MAWLTPAGEVVNAYRLLYRANNPGIALSAVAGGALPSKSWLGLFLADAATTLFFAFIVLRRVPESRPAPNAGDNERVWRELLCDRAMVGLLVAHVGVCLVFWQLAVECVFVLFQAMIFPRRRLVRPRLSRRRSRCASTAVVRLVHAAYEMAARYAG